MSDNGSGPPENAARDENGLAYDPSSRPRVWSLRGQLSGEDLNIRQTDSALPCRAPHLTCLGEPDEQYLKEKATIKETHAYTSQDGYPRVKNAEVVVHRHARPASYAGDAECRRQRCARPLPAPPAHVHAHAPRDPRPQSRDHAAQYASSGMLDELDSGTSMDALKTRSLPAFLRPKPRPLSTEDDLQQLYAKVSLSKKYKNRMRSEHAAIIALSKSRSQFFDADAVIVYDQRTAL